MRITTQMLHWDGCSNPPEQWELPEDGPALLAMIARKIARWEADGGTVDHWGGVDDEGDFDIEFIPSDDARMAGPEGVFKIRVVPPRFHCAECGEPVYKGDDAYYSHGCQDEADLCCSEYCAEKHGGIDEDYDEDYDEDHGDAREEIG